LSNSYIKYKINVLSLGF